MRLLLRQTIGRVLSILVALSLFIGTASAGMGAMAHDLGKAIKQALQPAIPSGFTEAPGPVFLGDKSRWPAGEYVAAASVGFYWPGQRQLEYSGAV